MFKREKQLKPYIVGSALVLSAAVSLPVYAQQSGSDDGFVEEVVVTARKREETLQDVPVSINAQTEESLRNSGANSLVDLAGNVASFTVQDLGPGQSQVAIRGISAGQIVRDQPGVKEQVGIYLDESVISLSLFTPDLDLFDLNRVEVLRGPQGTLFGSGSLSGTVRYITNQPDPTERTNTIETGLNVVEGNAGGNVKAVVNVPFDTGNGAFRAAASFTQYAGFIDGINPDRIEDGANDGERVNLRLSWLFQPNDNLTITPRIIYQDVDVDGFNRIDAYNILANPFTTTRPAVELGERAQFRQFQEQFEDEFLLVDAKVEYETDNYTLTSITSFTERDVLVFRDATQLTGSITGQPGVFTPEGFGEEIFTLDAPLSDVTDVSVVTQEFRVASSTDNVDWVAGLFYSDIERRYGQSLDVAGFEAATGIPTAGVLAGTDILFFSDIPYDFKQIALFGEATIAINDRLELTGGIRWFDFEEERILNFDGIFAAQTIGQAGRTTSDGFSPRILLGYELNENVQLNAQISEGFRLGGINDPLNEPLCSPEDLVTFGNRPSFEDEELLNYEVGAKTTIWGGKGTLNVAAFFADIDNLQATLDAGTCSSRIIFNVPEAESIGIEAELFARPTPNFEFGLSASITDSELKSSVFSTDANGVTTVVGGIQEGNRLPTVPEFQFAASATYDWPVTDRWDGFVSGSFQYVGDRFTQIGDQAPGFGTVDLTSIPIGNPTATTFTFDPELPSYNITNVRFGVRDANWEVALFVNNLTDERALLALDRERGGRARVGFLTNQPRTVGVQLRADF